MRRRHRRQGRAAAAGQAMTEMVVLCAFVLIPLLLLIPLLGKYIDIQHAAIQAARYEAWEYTVWYGSGGERPSGYTGSQPVKSPQRTQRESRRRFFSRTDLPVNSTADAAGYNPVDQNALWSTHRQGERLWAGVVPNNTAPVSSTDTPDLTAGIMNFLLDMIDTVFGAIADFIDTIGSFTGAGASNVDFDVINTDGYARSQVVVPVAAPEGLIDLPAIPGQAAIDNAAGQLVLREQAAVLTDAWNAGGIGHVQDRSGGIIPTRLLQELLDTIPGFSEVRNVIAIFIPEIAECDPPWSHPATYIPGAVFDPGDDGTLWLGYVNADAVPPERLGLDGSVDCPNGLCRFADDPGRAPCGGIPAL